MKTNRKKLSILYALLIVIITLSTVSCLETVRSMLVSTDKSPDMPAFTNDEAIRAMKDALGAGISDASKFLSQENAYFGNAAIKLLLPPEAASILAFVEKIPNGQKLVDDVILRLNRSAEEAAKEVVPIFSNAISSMTVADGINIVRGQKNAATLYLKDKTYQGLLDLYSPKLQAVLDKPLVMGISASKAWSVLIEAYNAAGKIPNKAAKFLGQPEPMPEVKVNLAKYSTQKALDGLFLKLEDEEVKIRARPLEYASEMINKVFGAILKGL